MSQCKWCGKSGIFLSLSQLGLCANCNPFIVNDLSNRVRQINESVSLMQTTKNVDVMSSRFDFIIKTAEHLYQYEQHGINTTNPPPSQYINGNVLNRDEIIVEGFGRALNDLKIRLLSIKTEKVREKHILIFIDLINKHKATFIDTSLLNSIEQAVHELLPTIKTDTNEIIEGEYIELYKKPIRKSLRQSSKKELVKVEDDFITAKHKASLVIFSDKAPSEIVSNFSLNVNVNIFTKGIEYIELPMDDPSTVFKKLNVRKPVNINNVSRLPYFPSYSQLDPEQRWVYLNWLEDIRQKIDIGYVFIYYYGLERQLLIDNFKDSFNEINFLRKFHDNNSFLSYSSSAIVFTSIFRNEIESLKNIYRNPDNDKIGVKELLINYFLEYDLSAKTLIQLAKSIKTINLRYYSYDPSLFERTLAEQIEKKYGNNAFPFASRYNLGDIPKIDYLVYANISFPNSVRSINIPDFLSYEPFIEELHSIFSDTHTLIKSKYKGSKTTQK